jgi:hypothetical protein
MSNITVIQNDAKEENAGLFGTVASSAVIKDLTIENATLNIVTGSLRNTASFGLLCGTLAGGANLENLQISGEIVITPTPQITAETTIGLLCGSGSVGSVDISAIACKALDPTDEYTDPISLTTEGNRVIVEVLTKE